MSGAELVALIGVLSGTITIVEAAIKAFDAARHRRLPFAFSDVTQKLSLVRETLEVVEKRIAEPRPDRAPSPGLSLVLESCHSKLATLESICHKITPHPGSSAARRFFLTLRAHGLAERVGTLIRAVLDDIHLIGQNQAMQDAAAEKQPQQSATSTRQHVLCQDGGAAGFCASFAHYGPGQQNIYNHGAGNQIIAGGPGRMHFGEVEIFN